MVDEPMVDEEFYQTLFDLIWGLREEAWKILEDPEDDELHDMIAECDHHLKRAAQHVVNIADRQGCDLRDAFVHLYGADGLIPTLDEDADDPKDPIDTGGQRPS